jgi:uncharacterized protein YdeI (YjbR/CyaY-like superfamily)
MKNPKVDAYFGQGRKWQEELEKLRAILLDSELTEDFKWGKPCYTFANSNVIILFEFKDCCAIGFFKGSLMRDKSKVLIQPGENSQAMRMIKFTDIRQVLDMEPILKAYIQEAIEVEKAGLEVQFAGNGQLKIPEEFQKKLEEAPALKTAFEALTPGRQRGYALYFSEPKQSKTRESRVEKNLQRIFEGKGLNDE